VHPIFKLIPAVQRNLL